MIRGSAVEVMQRNSCEDKEVVALGGGRSQDDFDGEVAEVLEVVHLELGFCVVKKLGALSLSCCLIYLIYLICLQQGMGGD